MGAGAKSLDSHPKVFNLAFVIIESSGLGLKLIDEEPLCHIVAAFPLALPIAQFRSVAVERSSLVS